MDNIKNYLEKYWGYLALLLWVGAAILFDLIRVSPFAIDEEAAKGLLLTWTVADNVVNPIVIFGVPDFRALLYVPIGAYWPGNLFAAKIMALLISFLAISMLYRWSRNSSGSETALLASALLLISPSLVTQTDSLSAGPYLLLGFSLGAWLNTAYRKNNRPFGGWYFSQLLWIAILTSIHPIALAYPIALAWHWIKNPHEHKNSRHMFVGISIATILSLLISGGWGGQNYFGNPIEAIATSLQGSIIWSVEDILWWPGIIAGIALAILMAVDIKNTGKDFLSLVLYLCIFIGLIMPDENWALICVALLLYRGTHYLVLLNQRRHKNGFIGQRGIVAVVGFILCTHFMLQDKNHALTIRHALLDPQDELIQSLIVEASDQDKPFRVASQWPARTMLATKRDALPLPPALDDQEKMLQVLKSVTHIAFDPNDPKNKALVEKLSNMASETETLALLKAGAIVRVKEHKVELSTQQRLAQEDKESKTNDNKEVSEQPQ